MLTLAPALLADLRTAAPRTRRIVSLTLVDGVEHHWCTGEHGFAESGYWYAASIGEIVPDSLTLDAFTRKTSWGECAIVFRADGTARQMLAANPVLGKVVRVRLGTERVAVTDYLTEWVGQVYDYETATNGEVTLRCADAIGYLDDLEITGGWIATHEVEIMRQILSEHVPAPLWNPAGFDFEADTTRSHRSISRYDARLTATIADATAAWARSRDLTSRLIVTARRELVDDSLLETPRNAWELMQDLAVIAGGILRLDSSGRLEFARYDPAAAVVAEWGPSTWLDRGAISYRGTLVNRVNILASVRSGTSGSRFRDEDWPQANDTTVVIEDTTAQTALAVAGSAIGRVVAETLDNEWLRAVGSLASAITSSDTTIDVIRAPELGFCGARYRYGFRGSVGGGIAVNSSSISGNVLTLNTTTPHWLETGAYITTDGLSTNVTTAAACTVVTTTQVTVPLVAANNATNGSGAIAPQQDPLDTLTGGRVAWFALRDDPDDPTSYEIVQATAGQATPGTTAQNDPRGTGLGQYTHPASYRYTITRAQLGTTAQAFDGPPSLTAVFDVTHAVEMAQRALARHAYGCPEVDVSTLLSEMAVQIGDPVRLLTDDYVTDGYDGADDVVWEVTSCNRDEGASPPVLRWRLARLRED